MRNSPNKTSLGATIGYGLAVAAVGVGILAWTHRVMHNTGFHKLMDKTRQDPQTVASCEETSTGGNIVLN